MDQEQQRPRGILTQADREFLRGDKETSDQVSRNTRRRIRNRVSAALRDLSVLWSFLDDDDLELIFERDPEEDGQGIRPAVEDMFAFGILGLWENDDLYTRRIEGAIRQAAFARNRNADVELSVEETLMDSPDEILHRLLDSGFEHVTYGEFEKALTSPDSDPGCLTEYLNELEPDDPVSVEEIEKMQEQYKKLPIVRQTLPRVISVEPDFEK